MKIFLSYRRGDSADVVGRIDDRLLAEFGRENVFKDVDSIPLGQDFRTYLSDAVGECDVLLVVIGERWLEAKDPEGNLRLESSTDFVRIEVEAALQREIPVVPVLLGRAEMPRASQLPEDLRELSYRNGTKVRPDPDFHGDMDRILDGLKHVKPKEPPAPEMPVAPPVVAQPVITADCDCGRTLRAPKTMAGRRVNCPECDAMVRLPGGAPDAAPAAAPARGRPDRTSRPAARPRGRESAPSKKGLWIGLGAAAVVLAGVGVLLSQGSETPTEQPGGSGAPTAKVTKSDTIPSEPSRRSDGPGEKRDVAPANPDVHIRKGLELLAAEGPTSVEAFREFARALEIDSNATAAQRSLEFIEASRAGLQAIKDGEWRAAIDALSAAVSIEDGPDHWSVRHGLGLAYIRTERTDDAIRELERAIELDSSQSEPLVDLGWAFLFLARETGSAKVAAANVERAADAFERALTINRENEDAQEGLKRVRELRRDSGASLGANDDVEAGEALLGRVADAKSAGEAVQLLEEAKAAFASALEANAGHEGAKIGLGKANEALEELRAAVATADAREEAEARWRSDPRNAKTIRYWQEHHWHTVTKLGDGTWEDKCHQHGGTVSLTVIDAKEGLLVMRYRDQDDGQLYERAFELGAGRVVDAGEPWGTKAEAQFGPAPGG